MEISNKSFTGIGGCRILLKRLTPLAVTFLALLITFSCGGGDSVSEPTQVTVSSVQIRPSSATLNVGETINLTATVYPETASDKSVSWYSSNNQIATVTDGKVTAIAEGTATITAYAGSVKAECVITVTPTSVTSITLSQTSVELTIGESTTITATISPENAEDKTITWSSSDTAVATVTNGTITAVAVGTATITASCGDVTAECTVTVNSIAVTSIQLSEKSVTLSEGGTMTLSATVLPADATNKTVEWTSSNAAIAAVNNGTVTAYQAGTAEITAQIGDISDKCTITVLPTSLSFSKNSFTINIDDRINLTTYVRPTATPASSLSWSSSASDIVSVSNGIITAHKKGKSTITVTCSNGATASCAITVIAEPDPGGSEGTGEVEW
ncbi:MAG: Ig domain-containing protein [Barnesiella sp.]|nr:Ig domain-containing protein [Barnesiella sp.]